MPDTNKATEAQLETTKEKSYPQIYVYKMWDTQGGYWTEGTPEAIERIQDSDSWFFSYDYLD